MDLEVRNILGYDTTRSGDRTLAESYPGTKNRHRPHPGDISKDDRTHHQAERWVRPIMISRAQIGALGDADVFTDFHECHVVNPTILAEPGILPNLEQPRIFHPDARLNDHPNAHLRPE